ncbi:hypothetical protein J6590_021557 [Homalodisca vitripennis]|nr:hypothetical protein J6590_021557 [Homalodisca vitripennis]
MCRGTNTGAGAHAAWLGATGSTEKLDVATLQRCADQGSGREILQNEASVHWLRINYWFVGQNEQLSELSARWPGAPRPRPRRFGALTFLLPFLPHLASQSTVPAGTSDTRLPFDQEMFGL